MGYEQDEIVNELKEKIKIIVSFLDKAREEKDQLKQELSDLNNQIKQKETELEELRNKYTNLKIAKSIVAGDDNVHDAKIKVNRIVREIDKCIALLNK